MYPASLQVPRDWILPSQLGGFDDSSASLAEEASRCDEGTGGAAQVPCRMFLAGTGSSQPLVKDS